MKVGEILQRLHRVRPCGDGWMACCPAHDDRDPSLSIRQTSGKVLLNCFAKCPPEDVCKAIGIALSDLFLGPHERREPEPPIFYAVQDQIRDLRRRQTPRERVLPVIVILATPKNVDCAIARALVLSVEQEFVQVVVKEDEK